MQAKPLLVSASILLHVGVLGGVAIASMWRIEKLPVSPEGSVVGLISPLSETSSAPTPRSGLVPPLRHITKAVVQPTKRRELGPATEAPSVTVALTRDQPAVGEQNGNGLGIGTGTGLGTGLNAGGCLGEALGSRCLARELAIPTITPPKAVTPEVPTPPRAVGATVINSLHLSGETQLQPDAPDKLAIKRAGKTQVTGTFKVCLDSEGRVDRVTTARTTGFAGYDARLIRGIGQWRYRPYQVDGRGQAVCGMVKFVYSE